MMLCGFAVILQLGSSCSLPPLLVLKYLVFLNISVGNNCCQYILKTFYFQHIKIIPIFP